MRQDAKLTQKKFAEKLGLKQNTIAAYEMGKIGVSDAVLLSICREFDINEKWLRTGVGKKEAPVNEDDRYFHNVAKLSRTDDKTLIRWVNAIAEANPDVLKEIEEFMKKILDIP